MNDRTASGPRATHQGPAARAFGHAFQTPSVALLAPDAGGRIGSIAHVGYVEPGKPHRFSPSYEGLTRTFCQKVDAVSGTAQRPAALQLASEDVAAALGTTVATIHAAKSRLSAAARTLCADLDVPER